MDDFFSAVMIREGSAGQLNTSPDTRFEEIAKMRRRRTRREPERMAHPRIIAGRLDWPAGKLSVRATAWHWHCLLPFFANTNFPLRSPLAQNRAQRTLRDADPHCWRKRGAMTSPRAYRAVARTRTARIDVGRCDDHPSSSPRRAQRRATLTKR